MYQPCSFSRKDYLDCYDEFENETLDDASNELAEFSNDEEDLALELAYTRYRLACAEVMLNNALPHIKCENQDQSALISAIGKFIEEIEE